MQGIPINTDTSPSVILDLIYRLKIKSVMSTNLTTAERTEPLQSIQDKMRINSISGVPVADKGRLLGIISVQDIIEALQNGTINDPAEQHMSRNLKVLEEDMPLSFAISFFDRYKYGRFPVLNGKRQLVGIITSRDIILALLIAMNKEVEQLEQRFAPAQADNTPEQLYFPVRKHDFEKAGRASTEFKKALKKHNIDTKIIRRIAIASYELEMNLVVHSDGGSLSCDIGPEKVTITASDKGPGISNLEEAMTVGFSTANEWIQSLGFGAGMGLPNTKRVSDQFDITSDNQGTTAVSVINRVKKEQSDASG